LKQNEEESGMNTPAKPKLSFRLMQASILSLAIVCGGGCRSHAYKKSDVAGKSLQSAAAEVQAKSRAIDVTLQALNNLVTQPAADLKPQFARFKNALDRLVVYAQRTDATRARMEQKNTEYFDAWDKQVPAINFGIIREESEARKMEVTNRFHSIDSRYLDAQAVVWPLINYFRDIRTALSVDLTADGLAAVKGIVTNADQNARKVQSALGKLADELTTSGTGMLSVVLQNPPPPTLQSTASVNTE
jgi:hypothetical protein